MLENDKTKERVERHKITQEDFTPNEIIKLMVMDLGDEYYTDFSKTILDTSCGIGNILLYVLNKRLENTSTMIEGLKAIKTLYGVEIMADNVEECRNRLYNTLIEKYPQIKDNKLYDNGLKTLLKNRIRWYDSLKFDYKWERINGVEENVSFAEPNINNSEKYPMWTDENEL